MRVFAPNGVCRFRHEAERLEQEARGKLERQKIEDEASAEEARKGLLELQVQLATLESTGQAKSEAQSKAEAMRIASQAEVEKARLEAEADSIKTVCCMEYNACLVYSTANLFFNLPV